MALDEANSLRLARKALPAFGLPSDTPLTFVKLRENAVFRVDGPDGSSALRLHRPGYRSVPEIAAESEFIEMLRAHGIPVVDPVRTSEGEYTTMVSEDGLEVIVDAQRWQEGSTCLGSADDIDPTTPLDPFMFRAMGRLAARMHTIAEALAGSRTFDRAPWDAEGLVGKNALWGDALSIPNLDSAGAEVLTGGRRFILDRLAELGTRPDIYGTIHADFTPDNVLTGRDATEVDDASLTLIDFDDFGDGWYLFDLATALFFYLRHPQYAQLRATLLDGYRSQRSLSSDHEALLDLFLVARGYTYLGWAATRSETETARMLIAEVLPQVVSMTLKLLAEG